MAEISRKAYETVEKKLDISDEQALSMIKEIEASTGIGITEIVNQFIIKGRLDSISFRRDNPRLAIYIRQSCGTIKVEIERINQNLMVEIPIKSW